MGVSASGEAKRKSILFRHATVAERLVTLSTSAPIITPPASGRQVNAAVTRRQADTPDTDAPI
jgi:hypothetical protein